MDWHTDREGCRPGGAAANRGRLPHRSAGRRVLRKRHRVWHGVEKAVNPLTAASLEGRFSFGSKRKLGKENCRCFDAADPRLRGCTPLRTPIRKSEGAGAKRTQYYCPFLTPPPLPPLLSRVFPRAPDADNGCSSAGASPRKGSPSGELAELARPEGFRRAVRYYPFSGNHPPTAKGEGCRPPLPLSSATHLWHPVGAGHARPSTLPLPPMYLLPLRPASPPAPPASETQKNRPHPVAAPDGGLGYRFV